MPKVHSRYLVKSAPSAAILSAHLQAVLLGQAQPSGLAVGTLTVGRRILGGGKERERRKGGREREGSHSGLDVPAIHSAHC